MPEVNTSFEQLLHRDSGQTTSSWIASGRRLSRDLD
jgi:hypothetical protein